MKFGKLNWRSVVHDIYVRAITISGLCAMVFGLAALVGGIEVPKSSAFAAIVIIAGLIAVVGSFIKEGTPIVKTITQKLKGKETELTMIDRVKQEEERMFAKK